MGSIPGVKRSQGGGHDNPLQDPCLENPMDRGSRQVSVHGVTKSQTQRKWLSTQARLEHIKHSKSRDSFLKFVKENDQNKEGRTSLVVQWLRIHLPMHGEWVQSVPQKMPHAVEQVSLGAATLKPLSLGPTDQHKRSLGNERPAPQLEGSTRSWQLENLLTQQQRPSAAKNNSRNAPSPPKKRKEGS